MTKRPSEPSPFTLIGAPMPAPFKGLERRVSMTMRDSAMLLASYDDDLARAADPEAPVAVLRVLVADGPPEAIPLTRGEFTLGRDLDTDIPIKHRTVSRKHLRLEVEPGRIIALLRHIDEAGVRFKDLHTTQSSLEDIFVSLVSKNATRDQNKRQLGPTRETQ